MAKARNRNGIADDVNHPELVAIEAPAGFDTIDDSFGEEWEPEPGGMLTGTIIGGIREFVANRGRPDEHIWRACNIAEAETGVVFTIKESASLRAWFDKLEEGMSVYIAYRGLQDVGKASPMKVFQAGIARAQAPRSVASSQGGRILRR